MRKTERAHRRTRFCRLALLLVALLLGLAATVAPLAAQSKAPPQDRVKPKTLHPEGSRAETPGLEAPAFDGKTIGDCNRRLEQLQLQRLLESRLSGIRREEYRIGPEDLLEITVFEAPEMNRSLRVSAGGEISLPLLGTTRAAGLTPAELESVLMELLRRTYMKDPHVGVSVREIQSHAVSVFGAVRKPGVYQIRGARTVVEVLSMAEGLADDAGDTVLVMRGEGLPAAGQGDPRSPKNKTPDSAPPEKFGPALATPSAPTAQTGPSTIEIQLKQILQSDDPRVHVPVYPGDVVKVTRAGIVYVVGEVKKPGGFVLRSNENISTLQAIALAEGLTRTAAKGHARIIRTDPGTGQRTELALDLGKILAGRAADPVLQPKDIVFVPNSSARSGFYRGAEAAVSIASGLIVFRR